MDGAAGADQSRAERTPEGMGCHPHLQDERPPLDRRTEPHLRSAQDPGRPVGVRRSHKCRWRAQRVRPVPRTRLSEEERPMTTAAEGLQMARDLLVRKGWTQGAFYRGGKHYTVNTLP